MDMPTLNAVMTLPRRQLVSGAVLLLVTLVLFTPSLRWLAKETVQHEQLRHAVLILLFAAVAMVMEERKKLKLHVSLDYRFASLLVLSFLCMAGSFLGAPVFLTASAFALALAAWLGFFYGRESEEANRKRSAPHEALGGSRKPGASPQPVPGACRRMWLKTHADNEKAEPP